MIIADIGDFYRFDSPDKLLTYAGLSPSTYQSGQLNGCNSHMEKRSFRYLRYALFNATKYVCIWDNIFASYFAKKRAEGKHYNVAISHAAKKLVRVIYHLEKSGSHIPKQLKHRIPYLPFEHLTPCSVCHAVFKVLIYIKCISAIHSINSFFYLYF